MALHGINPRTDAIVVESDLIMVRCYSAEWVTNSSRSSDAALHVRVNCIVHD